MELLQDWASYHCEEPRRIDVSRIDPSMLMCFYCRDEADLEDWYARFSVKVRLFFWLAALLMTLKDERNAAAVLD